MSIRLRQRKMKLKRWFCQQNSSEVKASRNGTGYWNASQLFNVYESKDIGAIAIEVPTPFRKQLCRSMKGVSISDFFHEKTKINIY